MKTTKQQGFNKWDKKIIYLALDGLLKVIEGTDGINARENAKHIKYLRDCFKKEA